jgi:hypothetical protein
MCIQVVDRKGWRAGYPKVVMATPYHNSMYTDQAGAELQKLLDLSPCGRHDQEAQALHAHGTPGDTRPAVSRAQSLHCEPDNALTASSRASRSDNSQVLCARPNRLIFILLFPLLVRLSVPCLISSCMSASFQPSLHCTEAPIES